MMELTALTGASAYLALLVGTIVEGDVVMVTAAALVSRGVLNPVLVWIAGSLGSSLGDQFYFYLFGGRLRRWIDTSPRVAHRGRALTARVRRHQFAMVFAMRFLPGLRVAIAAASAYAGVAPLLYSSVNLASALVWTALMIAIVAYAGPQWLPRIGLSGWWAVVVPALAVVIALRWLSRVEAHSIERQ